VVYIQHKPGERGSLLLATKNDVLTLKKQKKNH
jgi:hypothetical protein